MIPLRFSQLSGELGLNSLLYKDSPIRGISIDSRKFRKQELFIALRGERYDGHNFLPFVVKKDPSGVVVEESFFYKKKNLLRGLNIIIVNNTHDFLLKLASFLRERLNCKVISITGSCGKTTTKDILFSILSESFRVVSSPQSFNNLIGLPLTIFKAKVSTEFLILECGISYPREMEKLSSVSKPHHAIITNIGPSHLAYLKSLEGVFREKKKILRFTKEAVFINGDDKFLKRLKSSRLKVITFGFSKGCDFSAKLVRQSLFATSFYIRNLNTTFFINTGFTHQIYNALASISLATFLGIDKRKIKEALTGFKFNSMRTQLLKRNGLFIINDTYNSNPLSLKKALESVFSFREAKRKIIVLSDMLEQGRFSKDAHLAIGRFIAENKPDYLLCWGRDSFYIFKSSQPYMGERVFYFRRKKYLIRKIKKIISSGDLLFFKGSRNMRMEEVIEKI